MGSYPVTVLGTASTGQDQSTTIVKVDEVPLTGDTSLRMTSDVGDFIGQGLSYSFTPADGSFITYVGYPGATNAAHVEFQVDCLPAQHPAEVTTPQCR